MHCSADLTEERATADVDGDGTWEGSSRRDTATDAGAVLASIRHAIGDASNGGEQPSSSTGDQLLDPDGVVDDTLTVVVGFAGGVVVGLFLTIELLAMTGSAWALLIGVLAWLGATAYLVRRRTVQGAVAASGYAIALVLLLIPLLAFSPMANVPGGLAERGGLFLGLATFVVVPVLVAALIGWVASQYVPDSGQSRGR